MVNSPTASTGPKRTCIQCRSRKVRCDGRPDFCGNCERLRFDCSFQRSSDDSTENRRPIKTLRVPLEKRRVSLACTRCRSLKIRCQGEFPACANCIRRKRHCVYAGLKKSGEPSHAGATAHDEAQESTAAPTQPNVESAEGPGLGEHLVPEYPAVIALVEAYFEHLYPLPDYAFLHQKSLIKRCLEGSIEPCLILALCAVTTQLLKLQPYYPGSVSGWVKRAEEDLMQNIGSPSIPRLQALVLIIRYMIGTGQFSKAFMLSPLTVRAAAALHLTRERPDLQFLAQETRRRLMWSCTLLDGQFSVGLREYETIPPDLLEIQLPCHESDFQDGIPTITAPLRSVFTDSAKSPSLFAAAVRLKLIRRDIMRLTRSLKSPGISIVDLMRSIQKFEDELHSLYQSLTEADRYTPPLFSQSSEPVRLLLVHLSWHQGYCDLYRIFLTGYREAAASVMLQEINKQEVQERQALCLQHAIAIIRILVDFSESCTSQVIDFDVAICAYHSAHLVLFIPGTNPSAHNLSRTEAMQMVRRCQSILERFFATTPMANPVIKDLDALIKQYFSELVGKSDQRQKHVDVPADDNEATQVKIRQQLAIHSLIRQANFDNDNGDDGVAAACIPRSNIAAQLDAMSPTQSELGVPSVLDRATLSGSPVAERLQNAGTKMTTKANTTDQRPRFLQEGTAMQMQNVTDESIWHDSPDLGEWQDNMQLVFNPWMGFSESLEAYGLTLSLNEDYF